MKEGRDFAIWFMQNGFDSTPNVTSNMKLNKLLSFAQIISLALYNEPLFKDEMYAFKNGLVIENVRKEYKLNLNTLQIEANKGINLTYREQEVLDYTNKLFGDANAEELSMLSHQYRMWKEHYENSHNGIGYDTEKQKIDVHEILHEYQDDLERTRVMVSALNDEEKDEEYIVISNTKFFYDPKEISVTEEIKHQLEKFPAIDNAYSFYIDKSQGLVIY